MITVRLALIAFIRERALTLGLSAMQVDHWAFNASAAAFFDACGFGLQRSTLFPFWRGGTL